MIRRSVTLALIAILAFGGIAGAADKPAERTQDGRIKLSFWFALSGDNGEAFKKQIAAFNASQNRILVEPVYSGSYADTATKMMTALEAKTNPNGALMAAGPLYTGGQDDWTILEYIEKDREFDKADVFEGMWEYSTFNGRIAAIPYNISTPLLYYNSAILKAAGIDASMVPRTWPELAALARKAQASGNTQKSPDFWGFDTSDAPWLFKAMLMQNGNPVVEVKGRKQTVPVYDRADAVEVATFWKKLADDKVMPQYQHSNAEKRFLAGGLAYIVASSSRVARWSKDIKFELGAYPLPYFKKASVPLGGGGLVMFDKGKEANDATWQVIKYLMKPDNQATFALSTGYVPVRKSILDLAQTKKLLAELPLNRIAFGQLNDAWAYWHFDEMGTMDLLLGQMLERLEKGRQGPAEALKASVAELLDEMAP